MLDNRKDIFSEKRFPKVKLKTWTK